MAYEATEVFMNSTAPDDKISIAAIKKKIYKLAIQAIDGDNWKPRDNENENKTS